MHRLLIRQIRKLLSKTEMTDELSSFLESVSQAYQQSDDDRFLIERSLDLTSQELSERNNQLRQKLSLLELTHNELQDSLATLQATFDSTNEAIFSLDSSNLLISCNQQGKDIFAIARKGFEFTLRYSLRHFKRYFKTRADFVKFTRTEISSHKKGSLQTVEFKNGLIFEVYSSPRIQEGHIVGRVFCFRDVTEYRKSKATIEHQAFHDALTNLPNRILMMDRLEHAIAYAKRDNNHTAILFIDLDHFKKVNDSGGHQVGDELLVQVCQRINECIREHDTLARLGGDEFVVLVENIVDSVQASQLASRIIKVIEAPFKIKRNKYYIGCSIGISVYPKDGESVPELLRKADMSMYHAKELGRGNFQYFDESLERLAIHQLNLENQLRTAIKNDELSVYYQTKTNLRSDKICDAEALLRWRPDGKPVSPLEFIPVAEQSGLIKEITEWVIEEVCKHLSGWRELGNQVPKIAINLSSTSLNDKTFISFIRMVLNKYQIPGEWLEFEITETVLLLETVDVSDFIGLINELNISLAIDDFGTGYSSLSYLHKLPIDVLKIDKSFVLDLILNEHNQAITKTILAMAKSLNMKVVAEGIENQETEQWLKQHQCDFAQGFYYHRPMPENEFRALMFE